MAPQATLSRRYRTDHAPEANQTPERAAREMIDRMLRDVDWVVQNNMKIDFGADPRVAVGEHETDPGPAD